MTYYAQDQVDKWLEEHCELPERGVIVDVGAGDGINMSNSKYFEEKGWLALCVDGDPRNRILTKNRPYGENVVVSNQKKVSFYKSKISPDISGLIKYNEDVEEIQVDSVTLEELLIKHGIGKIDVLSIDTEGTEIDVFESMDFEKHQPRYLLIEFNTQGQINLFIEFYFRSKGYKTIGVVGPNLIFELIDRVEDALYSEIVGNHPIDRKVEELLENNEALKAWELVKDTDWPRKDRLWLRVKHAFNYGDYKKYYSQDLDERPVPEEVALDCTRLAPRFSWVIGQIERQKPETILDMGCADGYLPITLARRGFEKIQAVNLFAPSIQIAQERAEKFGLSKQINFEVKDLFDFNPSKDKYEAIILFEVLEHLPDPQKAIDHCMGLLNNDGSFYLSTPSPDHLGIKRHKAESHGTWDDGLPSGHLRILTEQELRELLNNYHIVQLSIDLEGCFNLELKNK